MTEPRTCPKCGKELPEGLPVPLCPNCLWEQAKGGENDDATVESGGKEKDEVTAPPATITMTGDKVRYLGDYELVEEIARGGMGVVYRAKQISLNRDVALKMILAGKLAGEADIARFHTEAEAAANLRHPNIVSIYEVGEHEGHHFFSMELVEGGSLKDLIKDCVADHRLAVQLIAKTAHAVHHAHQRGILHRDLKPANILLDKAGEPHITDFGLAKQVEGDASLTMSGAVLGTPQYMSPEQAKGDAKNLTTATDIYSLGVILYQLLTGTLPHRGDGMLELMRNVLEEEPATPSSINRKVDKDLETICLKCLSKDPNQRYGTALELAEDLCRFQDRKPILAKPPGQARRLFLWAQRKPGIAVTGALAVLISVLFTVAAIWFRFESLDHNAYSANLAATVIQKEIEDLQEPLVLAAHELESTNLIRSGDGNLISEFLKRQLVEMNSGALHWMDQPHTFHSLSLFNAEGVLLARLPKAESPDGKAMGNFSDRDHFKGATNKAHIGAETEPHVSYAFQSRTDPDPARIDKFGISIAVRSTAGTNLAGVLMATISTAPTRNLGNLEHHAALITRADRSDRRDHELLMIAHPKFQAFGKAIPVKDPWISSERTSKGLFIDPAAPNSGFWLAGKSSVENTPFIVVVQTRDHVTNALITAFLILIALTLGFVLYRVFQKRRSAEAD